MSRKRSIGFANKDKKRVHLQAVVLIIIVSTPVLVIGLISAPSVVDAQTTAIS
ncbi:MAG: hypothetical protein JO297_17810 [Nitrososphaeraceae archaeon]|nr:hypothetical protein [Nitrososphaeraceae archaeon]